MKISRPISEPGSPRDRSGMMTPGDFASLQEGREGLSTEDYIAWKLPEQDEEEDYPFPLTLKFKNKTGGAVSPGGLDGTQSPALNGNGSGNGAAAGEAATTAATT
jgi:glycogen(starch) synthase